MATIILKYNQSSGEAPTAQDLQKAEPAFNLADKIFFTKDHNGNIIPFKGAAHYDFTEASLSVFSGNTQLNFSANRFFTEYTLSAALSFNIAASGNIPGNRITCILVCDGESSITLPAACKVVRGSFNAGNGTKNLIEFQYFSSIIITKIYQIP